MSRLLHREEEGCVRLKQLKQAESLMCTKNTVHLPSSMITDSIALVVSEAEILKAYLVRSDCMD